MDHATQSTTRFLSAAGTVTAALIPLTVFAWSVDLHRMAGLPLFREQMLLTVLGLAVTWSFLADAAATGGGRRAVNTAVAAGAAVLHLHAAYRYPNLFDRFYEPGLYLPVLSVLLISAGLEALRRRAGLPLFVLSVIAVAYGLAGHLLSGSFAARYVPFERLSVYLAFDPNGILGLPLTISATVVVAFVLFGQAFAAAGGGRYVAHLSDRILRNARGRSAKISVVASGLFSSMSGSAVSNVASTGVITIPLMRRAGYPAHKAAAIEAVASTGGQLAPPVMGATAFLMAEYLGIPYLSVVSAALVPAAIYYAAIFIHVDLHARRFETEPVREDAPDESSVPMASGLVFAVPLAVIVACLGPLNFQPAAAAFFGAVTLIACNLVFAAGAQRIRSGDLLGILPACGRASVEIILICTVAGLVIGVVQRTGLGFSLGLVLLDIGRDSIPVLLFCTALACIVLGLGMPTSAIYVLLAAIAAPHLVASGIGAMEAHLFVFYFGMLSMITPPVAIASYAAASLASAPPWQTSLSSMRIAWSAYLVPVIFVVDPDLLFRSGMAAAVLSGIKAVTGIGLVSVALAGILRDGLSLPLRTICLVAGAAVLWPVADMSWKAALTVAGMSLVWLIYARQVRAAANRAGPAD